MNDSDITENDLTAHNASEIGCELIMSLVAPIVNEMVDHNDMANDVENLYAGMIGAIYGEAVSRFGYEKASDLLKRSLEAFQAIPQELFSGKKGH